MFFDCYSIVSPAKFVDRCEKFHCSARVTNLTSNPLIWRTVFAVESGVRNENRDFRCIARGRALNVEAKPHNVAILNDVIRPFEAHAAGKVHTDFERGFIRAETIAFADFAAYGGEQGAKDAGRMRLEGADYVIQDGDVMRFRFNV